MKFNFTHSFIIILIISFAACKNEQSVQKNATVTSDTTHVDSNVTKKVIKPEIEIQYHAWPIKTSDSLKKIFKAMSPDDQKILFALNRVDKRHISNIDTIIVPDTFTTNLLDYAPFPLELPIIKDVNKMVFFSYPIQAYAVYENGTLIKWGPTNMGKKATPTPEGLFYANWKGKEIKSSVNPKWILKWNMNISNLGGVGWHEYELPGYPASHSCLRLLAEDAKWLYDWADTWRLKDGKLAAKGTPTLVFGSYPWGERRPWKSILENNHALDITVNEIDTLVKSHLEAILEAQQQRKIYLDESMPTVDSIL